ncbi:MAG: DNA adenine methylase [Candidatus Gorgyraea atricola]|nr:DNA adenine methylase [Candidatus Gorgyraea atricola]
MSQIDSPKAPIKTTIKISDEIYFRSGQGNFVTENYGSTFQLQNRRYLGNKYKLLDLIEDIIEEKCVGFKSLCDIFAGTGVVGGRFNKKSVKIISNDILKSNFIPLSVFLASVKLDKIKLFDKIKMLNNLKATKDNYISRHFGNAYFSLENARKIGTIRETIEVISESIEEKNALLTSLLYASDKVANTVGHYDAYRQNLDMLQSMQLLMPDIKYENNIYNEIYCKDANRLIRDISCDILYIDPPYNSRQYCDSYHVLENLVTWEKPKVYGKAKKMDRSHLKSRYCLKNANEAFFDLVKHATCKHILVSYNNTGESKDDRSNSRIKDKEIIDILRQKGTVRIFERTYRAFTTGKSTSEGHTERVFYCKVV